ncbi:MAG: hypothetical protein R3F59_03190 [Myxococcota bacterium]
MTAFEAHLVGLRTRGPDARDALVAALAELGWVRSAAPTFELEVQDRDGAGLWARGIGDLAALPGVLARCSASAVQHYVAKVDGDTIAIAGATWFPGRAEPVPITAVADGWTLVDEDRTVGPETLALGTLEVAAAMREGWDLADAGVERWGLAAR